MTNPLTAAGVLAALAEARNYNVEGMATPIVGVGRPITSIWDYAVGSNPIPKSPQTALEFIQNDPDGVDFLNGKYAALDLAGCSLPVDFVGNTGSTLPLLKNHSNGLAVVGLLNTGAAVAPAVFPQGEVVVFHCPTTEAFTAPYAQDISSWPSILRGRLAVWFLQQLVLNGNPPMVTVFNAVTAGAMGAKPVNAAVGGQTIVGYVSASNGASFNIGIPALLT